LFRGGRPEPNPGIVAGDRRRPAASNNTDSITPSSGWYDNPTIVLAPQHDGNT